MILKKISNDIANANWLAVLIELVIIVAGVYGAFQLERWGENRRESREEQVMLEQLHNEIELASPVMEARLLQYQDLVSSAVEVGSVLMHPVGSKELSDDQCDRIFRISILGREPLTLISLDEMVSSGKHSQLDDRDLRTLLFTLKSKIQAMEVFSQMIRPQQNILMDMYPELMPRGIDDSGEMLMNCDTDGMRGSQGFINHLMSNLGRYRGFAGFKGREFEALQNIHDKLDEVLETSNSEGMALHDKAPQESN